MVKRFLIFLLFIIALLALLWINPLAKKQTVSTTGWEQLIPSDKVDAKVQPMKGNNNLDVIEFNNRYYLAFRTAPSHFASKKTKLYIISSGDLKTWDYEHEIHLGSDLREPRFAVFKDTLFFYFFEGGKHPLKFEPQKVWMTYLDNGHWKDKLDLQLDGFVPWRFRVRADTLFLSAYYGKDLYNKKHVGNQRLFYSSNGFDFLPISESPQVPEMGAEEGEFIFDQMGNLYGTLRMEGDGSMVVFAAKNNLKDWITNYSKFKYDSALLFEYKQEIYLISRRNLDGESKKSNWRLYNMIRYSFTKKKTTLFHLDKGDLTLSYIKDFPSTGDTAFPGIVPLGNGQFFLVNYSSDINGKEKNWIKGQLGKTYLYSTIIDMEEILK